MVQGTVAVSVMTSEAPGASEPNVTRAAPLVVSQTPPPVTAQVVTATVAGMSTVTTTCSASLGPRLAAVIV
jgi:hypothetical protein